MFNKQDKINKRKEIFLEKKNKTRLAGDTSLLLEALL